MLYVCGFLQMNVIVDLLAIVSFCVFGSQINERTFPGNERI